MTSRSTFPIGRLAGAPRPDMPLAEAVTTRRTVRRYADTPIPVETLERLLRMSTHAPSACNRRGWRFILLEDPSALQWLYEKGGAAFIPKAKQAILACYQSHSDNSAWNDDLQSAAAAITIFQLLAHAEGIGSCWVCHLPPKREIMRRFALPHDAQPIALLTVGRYDANMQAATRTLPDKPVLCRETWTFPKAPRPGLAFRLVRFGRRIYYLLPKREIFRKFTSRFEKTFDTHD